MKNIEIEVVRYKRETKRVVIQVPDDLNLNLSAIRNLGSDLLEQKLIGEDGWISDVEEFAGATLVKETDHDKATVLVELT
jgi:hypothetical protein